MLPRLRALAGVLLVALIALAAPAAVSASAAPATASPTAHATRACANAGTLPTTRNVAKIRRAILCLVNRQRARAGLRKLSPDRRLRAAAQRHSRDMVARRYFDHTSPDGHTLMRRVTAAGYRASWAGENIAWGTAGLATPAATVRAWMSSPGHRVNILTPRFRHSGVGVAIGTPRGAGAGATYTHDFGAR
jgi:uncharacterized protein YkwD